MAKQVTHAATNLIPMDRRVLGYLIECDGSAPHAAIPAKLFAGEPAPEGHPNMVVLGLIEHRGKITVITSAGRKAFGPTSDTSNL